MSVRFDGISAADRDEGLLYWLWLQERLGFGSRYMSSVLDQPGRARFIYERTENDLWSLGLFPPGVISRLSDKSLDTARRILDRCRSLGIGILTPDDRLYPQRLMNIADPPSALYCLGSLPNIDSELCLAVVGTRAASAYGAALAQELAERMTAAGCLIISGAARGIDTAAHQGALLAPEGKTVAVLGCGINYRYNMDGAALRDIIALNGALVSEYPPDTSPSVHTFPVRNRIISGFSLGVTVIEAGIVSGSINTAHHALNQSRDVFAVSSSILPVNSEGVLKLLEDGAISVSAPVDILEQYADIFAQKLNITDDCSLPFMNERPRGAFKASLNDVFSRFTYVYGKERCFAPPAPACPGRCAEERLDDYDECYFGNISGKNGGCRLDLYYEDLNIFGIYGSDADSEIDRLYGQFIPSWRIPAPGLSSQDGSGVPERVVCDDGLAENAVPSPEDMPGAPDEGPPEKQGRPLEEPPEIPAPAIPERPEIPAPAIPEPPEAFGVAINDELSDDAKKLLAFLTEEPVTADLLTFRSGLPSARLLSALTELELYGLAAAHSGKRYSLSK